ncbi:MAG: nucleotide sugar dehydrogenase [Collinsella sp.]|nr:nucleotide sugar dehydrogenase [Collinsella sp.]
MRIAVIGLGYVGLSLSCLLARQHDVDAFDVDAERIALIEAGTSPLREEAIERFLAEKPAALRAHAAGAEAYARLLPAADLIIIATPTNYDDRANHFDTSSVDEVLAAVERTDARGTVVIKSTIPVGYTDLASRRHPTLSILFSPEFLREGTALADNLHPTRIVVGVPAGAEETDAAERAQAFAALLAEASDERPNSIPQLIMGAAEAESVKLFANTYLALRIAFFNELDTYAESRGMSTERIIEGVCTDDRIGAHYNNPSFGYGGYCLPKDSKQLLANYSAVPQNLMQAIVDSNATRKSFIAEQIIARRPATVGVYRLVMKAGSDNFRSSSIIDIVRAIAESGIRILIYEPTLDGADFEGWETTTDLSRLKDACDLIICNRTSPELDDVSDKVYTRDIWSRG